MTGAPLLEFGLPGVSPGGSPIFKSYRSDGHPPLDGAPEVTISGNPDASTCAFGTFLNDPSSPRALISTFSNSDAFGLSFPGQVAGTYPTGSGFGTLDSTDFATDGTIIVTEFGIVGGLIVGTFDLTISNGSLLSQSFTGNFSVTRELDDELDTADVDCQ